jgi:hypothetical protein
VVSRERAKKEDDDNRRRSTVRRREKRIEDEGTGSAGGRRAGAGGRGQRRPVSAAARWIKKAGKIIICLDDLLERERGKGLGGFLPSLGDPPNHHRPLTEKLALIDPGAPREQRLTGLKGKEDQFKGSYDIITTGESKQ